MSEGRCFIDCIMPQRDRRELSDTASFSETPRVQREDCDRWLVQRGRSSGAVNEEVWRPIRECRERERGRERDEVCGMESEVSAVKDMNSLVYFSER